jgi:hypothetical protein
MRRPPPILSWFAITALSAAGAWEATASAQEAPAIPRRTVGVIDVDDSLDGGLDGGTAEADGAFRAWLRAHQRGAAASQPEPPTIDEIKAELRQQNQVRELLGDNRFRRLERARFRVHVYELQLQPSREFEQVSALYEDIEGAMRSNFGKIARDWLEHRLGLAERFERWEQRRDERRVDPVDTAASPALSFSPRLAAGSSPYVGTKIRLRNAPNRLLSNLSLKTHYRLDDGETALRLTWQTRDHYVSLEQVFDDRYLGDVASLSLRFTF